jgi:hypothetical protein
MARPTSNSSNSKTETSKAKSEILNKLLTRFNFKVEKSEIKYLKFSESGDFVNGVYGGSQRLWNKKLKNSKGEETGGFEYRHILFSLDFSVMQILPINFDLSDKLRGIFPNTEILVLVKDMEEKNGYMNPIFELFIEG